MKNPLDHYYPTYSASGRFWIPQFLPCISPGGCGEGWNAGPYASLAIAPVPGHCSPSSEAEGGASVVVFAVLLASRVNSGCHGNPSRGREGEGRSEGEFLPLSAGSLNGDLQRMQTEGPEKDSGLGVLHGPPHFPAQPGSKFALHPTSLLLSGRDVGLSSCHRGFWVSGKKSWGG